MKERKIVNISFDRIISISLVYLILPIIIFFFGWLKMVVAIPASILLVIATIRFWKDQKIANQNKYIEIELRWLMIAICALLFFVWIAGVGRLSVSNYDSPWRDAVFNDLINYSWPVVYPHNGYKLVYYFTFWMIPALIGKVGGVFAGNIAMIAWVYIGLILVFLLLNYYLGTEKKQLVKYILLLLIFYNGIKYFGMLYVETANIQPVHFDIFHSYSPWLDGLYNGHAFDWYYRFNFDAVCEIFNQTIIVWLSTIFVLMNSRRIENYAFIGIVCFAYAPVAFLGMFSLLFLMGIAYEKNNFQGIKKKIIKACSIQNIFSCLSILIPFGLFYKTNTNAGTGIMLLPVSLFGLKEILSLIVCYVVEFGIYAWVICRNQKKNKIYYIILFILMISAFLEFGHAGSREINMNATLPALFILMIMILEYIRDNMIGCILNWRGVILILSLTLAALTPIGHMVLRINTVIDAKSIPVENSWIETYADKRIDLTSDNCFANFLVENQKSYFDYIGKEKSEKNRIQDEQVYSRLKNGKNEIIEGEYTIKLHDDEKYISISDYGLEMIDSPSFNKVIIKNGESIITSVQSNYSIDVPDGNVDLEGTVGVYERNDSIAQRFSIDRYNDSYIICYKNYYLCFDDNRFYLKENNGTVDTNGLWDFELKKE